MSTNNVHDAEGQRFLPENRTQADELTPTAGLRQRKKDDTRNRVREAAISVALREGCQKATVDVITREADVAARTFFNYFESKEVALVGIDESHIRAAAEQALSKDSAGPRGSSIADDVVALVVDVLVRAVQTAPGAQGRRELLKQNPELFEWQIRELDRVGTTLRPVVAAIASDRSADPVTEAIADQIFMTCLGAVAATGRAWLAARRTADPTELVKEAAARVHDASGFLVRSLATGPKGDKRRTKTDGPA